MSSPFFALRMWSLRPHTLRTLQFRHMMVVDGSIYLEGGLRLLYFLIQ